MKSTHHTNSSKLKTTLIALVIILLAGGAYIAYATQSNLWPFQDTAQEPKEINKPTSDKDEQVKNAGNDNQTKDGNSTPDSGVSDLGGKEAPADTTSHGIQSDSGVIMLHSPSKDQLITSGTLVSGTSKTTSVSYRIKDTERGVIGQGQLTVNNGSFSGKLTIHSSANSGTLEIFSLDNEGREINRIKIPVRFSA